MTSLVLELQQKALDGNCRVSDLLRMALVVATKLGVTDFEKWVDAELNGYQEGGIEIPKYRILQGSLKAKSPYHGWLPLSIQADGQAEALSTRPFWKSVGEIEGALSRDKQKNSGIGEFILGFPPDLERDLMAGISGPCQQVAVIVNGSQFHAIVEAVRNAVLDWSLKLEAAGILGESMTFSSDEKARAKSEPATYQVQNQTIQNQTVIQSMSQSQIQQGTTESTQIFLQSPPDKAQVAELIKGLRGHLETSDLKPDARAEVEADLATVEAQNASPKPRLSIMKEALNSVRSVLMEKAIGAAADSTLPTLLDQIKGLFS